MTRQANKASRRHTLLFAVIALFTTIVGGDRVADAQTRAPGWRNAIEWSLDTWNSEYGSTVRALGWTNLGRIADEAERASVVASIADPDTAWFPSVDTNDPLSATSLHITDDPTIDPDQIAEWIDFVDGAVRVGHRMVEIEWTKDGHGTFTSLCIVGPVDVVYGTMVSNIAGGGVDPFRGRKCLNYRMWWAWQKNKPQSQWTRGHIFAYNNPTCRNGQVVACDYDCNDVSMTLGDAKLSCKTTQINDQCCQLTYSWAWKTSGFKSIKVGADGFTLEIEGSIGSSSSGGGSCTVCCNERGSGGGCAGDHNEDGSIDSRDLIEFLNDWARLEADADFNGDGRVDTADMLAFIDVWSGGCAG